MSVRLLLESFLGLMKEDGELDRYLPVLLAAMGHRIVVKPERGSRQYGVDILSVGPDADGNSKVFLWVVKRGTIGRSEWGTGNQSVTHSLYEIEEVYLQRFIPGDLSSLPRKVAVVTNGDFQQSILLEANELSQRWKRKKLPELIRITGADLAEWSEKNLFNEYFLPPQRQHLFRRMLAMVDTPELSFRAGRELIDGMLADCCSQGSVAKVKKAKLSALRGVRATLLILHVSVIASLEPIRDRSNEAIS